MIIAVSFAALLLAVGGIGAARPFPAPVPEQLVEGHTVWLTIDTLPNATREVHFAAAVAVLVRELVYDSKSARFPGVLWFNDQYLTDPSVSRRTTERERIPCSGVVIGVNRGHPVDQDLQGYYTLVNAEYLNESYLVTDPNDRTWTIDLWRTEWGTLAWTSALLNNQAAAGVPDDGSCRGAAYTEGGGLDARDPRHHRRTGQHGMGYPCPGCDALRYNAVLYFRLEHLEVQNVTKDHHETPGTDWWTDASGCHRDYKNEYPCPGGNDTREGNSHPYHPEQPWPAATYDGRENHGGSAPCTGGQEYFDCHATRDIDLYYGYMPAPLARTYWLVDVTGSSAPYHCHDDIALCDEYDLGRV